MATFVDGIGALSVSITNVVRTGSNVVVTAASIPDSVAVGQLVWITGVTGTITNINSIAHTVTVKTSTTVEFVSAGSGTYTSGGTLRREYQTIEAWESSTGGAFGNNFMIGELYADAVFEYLTPSATLTFAGAAAPTSIANRELRAWSGHYYDTFTGEGALIRVAVDSTFNAAITVQEPYFKLRGFGLEVVGTSATTGTYYGIDQRTGMSHALVDGVKVFASGFSAASAVVVLIHLSRDGSCYNSILYFEDGQNVDIARCLVAGNLGLGGQIVVANVTTYGAVGTTAGTGITWTAGGTHSLRLVNCASVGCSSADFNITGVPTVWAACVSSDTTAGSAVAGITNVSATAVFRNVAYADFRVLVGSACVDTGLDYSALFTTDSTGATRVAPWEIGAFQGFVEPDSVAPTVVESTVGATGRDYATLTLWEAATRLNLIDLNVIHRAVMYDDGDFNESLTISGAVTDSRRYREVVSISSQRYSPHDDTGVVILNASADATLTISEDFFRMRGVLVQNTKSAGGVTQACISVQASGVVLDGVTAKATAMTGSSPALGFALGATSTTDNRVRNCIAIGGTNTAGLTIGFGLLGSGKIQNCAAIKCRRGTTGTGFTDSVGVGSWTVENCVGVLCDIVFAITNDLDSRSNASSDTTAPGLYPVVSIVNASTFVDATNNDLRLISTSPLVNAGQRRPLDFTTDVMGDAREGGWEIGPYADFIEPPTWPRIESTRSHRMAALWTIRRRDGVEINVASHHSPLVHAGVTYDADAGVEASVLRRESALTDHTMEATGFLTSDRITVADLDAGLYNGSIITLRMVDWRFPWLKPQFRGTYFLRRVSFDNESWRAEMEGIGSLLKRASGRLYGASCPYQFGSPLVDANGKHGCGVDITGFTVADVTVNSITNDRLIFRASTGTLPSTSDGYYTKGWLEWATGDNAGTRSEIRDFTNATREITLFIETAYPIQTGDTFSIVAGDDHTFETCRTKFANGINFGGQPYLPGSQKAMQTPTQ